MKIFKTFFVVGAFVALFLIFHHFGCAKGENVAIDIGTLDTPTNVKVNSSFTYDFDKAVQTETVTTSTFFILPTPTPKASTSTKTVLSTQKSYDASVCNADNALLSTVSCSSNMTCVLEPKAILDFSTSYTICLTTEILYEDGTAFEGFTLQIITEENSSASISPKVVSISPTEDSVGFAKNGAISITFNKDIDKETLTPTTFFVSKIADGVTSEVTGSIAYDAKQFKATFTATDDFPSETQCTVNVSKEIKDKEGQNLDKDYEWSFTTGDFVAPTIVETIPASGDTSADLSNNRIYVEFSENVDESTVNDSTFIVIRTDRNGEQLGEPFSGTYTVRSNTVSFTPTPPVEFKPSTNYKVSLTTGIKDLSGNSLSEIYEWAFTAGYWQ